MFYVIQLITSSQPHYDVDTFSVPTQMRKPRQKVVKQRVQKHTVAEWGYRPWQHSARGRVLNLHIVTHLTSIAIRKKPIFLGMQVFMTLP